jgi:lipid II:glycine glycyltransferase (peptidoglycan interpeptide bridge formation enzyme)
MRPRWVLARDRGRIVGAALVLRPHLRGLPLPAALVERGPVTHDPDDVERVAEALAQAARRRGIARVQLMPYWAGEDAARVEALLVRARFRRVQAFDGAHAMTLRMDIAGKDDAILAGKEKEQLRRKLRQAEKAGAVVRQGGVDDVGKLEQLFGELMRAQGRSGKPRVFFERLASEILASGERGALFVCTHEAETIAAIFASRHGPLATFVMGATSSAPRPFSKMVLPMFAAVKWARDAGCATFDLGGVPMDGDADEKRASIAQFKFDFAKTKVPLVREHVRWF